MKMTPVTLILIFVNPMTLCASQTYDDYTNLRSTLLTSYNTDVLPIIDQTGSLNINLTTHVFMMSEVDQIQGAITMGLMVQQEWFDEKLTWTPADHNGITNISIKSEDVWTPPLTLANPIKFTMLDQSWMQVMIHSNGKIMYTVGGIISFTCSFYMKFWPFDKQVCAFEFFVYGYPSERLSLSVPGTVVSTQAYSKNGEWILETDSFQYSMMDMLGSTKVVYSFKISRLPAFYFLTVILPVNGLGVLICLVFLMPSESGERVGYSITVMLSLAVFLTITAEELPKNSEPLPIMCLYIFFNMVVCVCAMFLVILNLKVYYRSDDIPISRFYKTFVRYSRCNREDNRVQHDDGRHLEGLNKKALSHPSTMGNVQRKIAPKQSLVSEESSASFNTDDEFTWKTEDPNKQTTSLAPTKGNVQRKIVHQQTLVSEDSSASSNTDDEITWKIVSEGIDKLLFYGLLVLTYIPSIIILIYVAAGTDYVSQ